MALNRLSLAVAAAFLASPARAGKLDLDLYGGPRPQFGKSRGAQVPAGELWRDPSAEDKPKK